MLEEEVRVVNYGTRIEDDDIVLSTGTKLGAYAGVVGIGPFGHIYGGYDQTIDVGLTPDEELELANYMIRQWSMYRERVLPR